MWVVIRLVLAAIGFLIRMPWRVRKIGEPAGEYQGIPYFVKNKRHWWAMVKGRRVYDHYIGMALQSPTWVRMTWESDFDRWCKRVGIANEQSTGDAEFDEKVYVTCDHPFVGALLATSPELRTAIRKALREGYDVHYDGSFVWLVDDWVDKPPEPRPELVDPIRRASMPLQDSELPSRFKDPFLWKAFIVEGVIWAIAAYAFGLYVEFAGVGKEFVHVSLSSIVLLGLGFAIMVFALLVAFIILFMRGSSRGHRVTFESVLVLAISLPVAGFQLANDTNRELDNSPPFVRAGVARVCEYKAAKNGPIYMLHMEWAEPPIPADVKVSQAICQSVKGSTPVTFTLGTGFWGVTWYRRIETPTATWTPGQSRW